MHSFILLSLFVYIYFDNLVSSTSYVIIFMSISITYERSALLIQMQCSAFFMFYRAPYPDIPVSVIVSISMLSINVYHHKFIICHFLFNHRKPPFLLLMLWIPRTP